MLVAGGESSTPKDHCLKGEGKLLPPSVSCLGPENAQLFPPSIQDECKNDSEGCHHFVSSILLLSYPRPVKTAHTCATHLARVQTHVLVASPSAGLLRFTFFFFLACKFTLKHIP